MKEKLSKDRLIQLLSKLTQSESHGLSEAEGDAVLLDFCAGCPDPVKARWLIVECLDSMTDEELVGRALAMPLRAMSDVSESELPSGHRLRTIAL